MSSLLLDDRRPDYALSKSLNTFQKRHHLRVWPIAGNWDGLPVWTASSTQDIAIGFSRRSHNLIHIIDEFIDSERLWAHSVARYAEVYGRLVRR